MDGRLLAVHLEKSAQPRTAWALGKSFLLPQAVFEKHFSPFSDASGRLTLPAEIPAAPAEAQKLRLRAAFTPKQPLFARFPLSYQRVPSKIRSVAAGWWGKHVRDRQSSWGAFPRWPLDLSADFLSDALGEKSFTLPGGKTPVLLSHDLDSSEGLKNLVHSFLRLEKEAGAHSTNFIVPCGGPLDHELLKEVRQRGCELGIHGYDHSNRTPFCTDTRRNERLQAARGLIDRYEIKGYRAPSLLRTEALLRDLGRYYRYDSSIPTSGGPFPSANNGCASARPFGIGALAELPVSLPRDGSLLFLGHTPRQILELWKQCACEIADSGGIVVLLTHCERRFSGGPEMLAVYREFLGFIRDSGRFFWSTPAEVLQQQPAALSAARVL